MEICSCYEACSLEEFMLSCFFDLSCIATLTLQVKGSATCAHQQENIAIPYFPLPLKHPCSLNRVSLNGYGVRLTYVLPGGPGGAGAPNML